MQPEDLLFILQTKDSFGLSIVDKGILVRNVELLQLLLLVWSSHIITHRANFFAHSIPLSMNALIIGNRLWRALSHRHDICQLGHCCRNFYFLLGFVLKWLVQFLNGSFTLFRRYFFFDWGIFICFSLFHELSKKKILGLAFCIFLDLSHHSLHCFLYL